jgi:hypothetical protein
VKLYHACTLVNSAGPLAWASGRGPAPFGLSWVWPKKKKGNHVLEFFLSTYWCRNKNFACSFKTKIFLFFLLFTDIRIRNKKKYFSGYEFLPTPELELFVVEFLIGIICVGIFTNARVGIIRGGIFNWNYLCWNIYQRYCWIYSWWNF